MVKPGLENVEQDMERILIAARAAGMTLSFFRGTL
jgi:hypothetical protein